MLGMQQRATASRRTVGIGAPARTDSNGTAAVLARRFDLGPLDGAAEELGLLESWIGKQSKTLDCLVRF